MAKGSRRRIGTVSTARPFERPMEPRVLNGALVMQLKVTSQCLKDLGTCSGRNPFGARNQWRQHWPALGL